MAPYTLHWGIISTGGIATDLAKDILIDPATRNVSDVAHKIAAVGSTTSVEKSRKFVEDVTQGGKLQDPKTINCYGNYEELVNDPSVDIVYIGTPHNFHYDNCLLALRAGKHVCCEKPFTINAAQAKHLVKVAKEKNLFLMEAVWTRFFPLTIEVRRLLHEKKILGDIHRVNAHFGMYFKPDPNHRIFNPELGGGIMLDGGIYAITWCFMVAVESPENGGEMPPVINGTIIKSPLTGTDENTAIVMALPKTHTMAIATANTRIDGTPDMCVEIQGTKGYMRIPYPPYRPTQVVIKLNDKPQEVIDFPIPGHGMFWEADACARCIRDGKIEAEGCPLSTTLKTMEVMDIVREQNGFKYADKWEKLEG